MNRTKATKEVGIRRKLREKIHSALHPRKQKDNKKKKKDTLNLR
jgi:hypothetical protein